MLTDLKRVPELPRRAMSCVEDDARTVGGKYCKVFN